MHTTVRKWGNSLALRIPKTIAKDSDLEEGSTVQVTLKNGKIILDARPAREYKLRDLLSKITKKNLHQEINTGTPAGKELL